MEYLPSGKAKSYIAVFAIHGLSCEHPDHRATTTGQSLAFTILYTTGGTEMLRTFRYVTETFSTTCAVHLEDCEGWWLSSYHSSVVEHWQLKPRALGNSQFLFVLSRSFKHVRCSKDSEQ